MKNDAKTIQLILNHMIRSLKEIVPFPIDVQAPTMTPEPYVQKELSVLIGLVGALKGRIVIDTTLETIQNIGQEMFKMAIEEHFVESLSGEIGNMLAGNLCVGLESDGLVLDISTPTVMTGQAKFHGFGKAITLPVTIAGEPRMKILIMLDEE